MKNSLALSFLLVLCAHVTASEQLIMAHRGASGYLPEHTLAAKAMAHAQGAHFLEQDVVLTSDGIPLVLHDIHLDTLTDVATQFPQRRREDGRFYAIDFTLAEIKQLNATQRFDHRSGEQVYPDRFPAASYTYKLHTLEEEIRFIEGLNKSTGRDVGLFPEIKQTSFHEREGHDIDRIVFDLLQAYGYGHSQDSNVIIHSFDPRTLRRLRQELGWQAGLELAMGSGRTSDGIDYEYLSTPQGLQELATYADRVWAPTARMMSWDENGRLHTSSFVSDARAAGLVVYGGVIVTESLPKNCPSLDDWHDALFNVLGVDGVVTDFSDLAARWLQQNRTESRS